MYCDLKFAQIMLHATYHTKKSHKYENSYSYDLSAVTEVLLSVFVLSKHGKVLALFSLKLVSWVQIENLSRVDFSENFHYFYFCQNMAIHKVST